jgi:RHS repeat-associated protein
MRFFTPLRVLVAGLAIALSPFVRGQSSDAQSISVYLAAKATYWHGPGTGVFDMSTDVENPDGTFTSVDIGATLYLGSGTPNPGQVPVNIYTAPKTVTLDVGRVYWLQVGTNVISSMTIRANPPPGYEVHFFDTSSSSYDNVTREYRVSTIDGEPGWDGHFGTIIGMCITPEGTAAPGGQAGSATALSISGASWRIFMGYLPNGLSAGYLEMNDRGRAAVGFTDALNSDALAYVAPSPEIIVHSDGAAGRRIFAYEAGVSIQPLSISGTGYTISFYHNSQVTQDILWGATFSGSPFLVYTIEQDGASPINLKITRTATGPTQTITKVATIKRTGSAWPNYTFTLADWHTDGQPALVTATSVLSAGTGAFDHNEAITLASTAGGTSQVSTMQVQSKAFGEVPTQTQSGITQAEIRTINYYDSDSNVVGAYARPKLISANNGAGPWEAYEYFSAPYSPTMNLIQYNDIGMVLRTHRPFKNTPVPAATDDLSISTAGVVTTYDYASDGYSMFNGRSQRPTDELTQIDGVTVAHASTSYADDAVPMTYAGLSLPVVTATRTDYSGASNSLTTITRYIREYSVSTMPNSAGQFFGTTPFFRKQVLSVQKPDGTKQVYAYQRGTYIGSTFTANNSTSPFSSNPGEPWFPSGRTASTNPSAASRIAVITGTGSATDADGTSNTPYSSETGFPIQTVYLVDGKSTRTVTIRDLSALVRRTETWAWVGGSFQLVASEDLTYDSANNLISKVSNTGATYTAVYDGGRKASETDAAGITITYSYDDAGRVSSATKTGVGTQIGLRTDYTYDAAGRTISEDIHAVGGTEHLIITHTYDDAGRLVGEAHPGKGSTSYSYVPASNQVTATLSNGGTRVEVSYPDGQKHTITGTGVVAQYFSYEIQTGGVRHNSVNTGSLNSSRVQETWTDWLGRETKTSHPTLVDGVPGSFVETRTYDSGTGLLATSTRADGAGNSLYADTLYRYDALGQLVRTAQHVDTGAEPNLAGNDRITDTFQYYEQHPIAGPLWLTKQTVTYPTAGSSIPRVVSLTRQRLSGFTGGLQSETETTDIEGNVSDTQTTVNRAGHTTTVSTTATGYLNAQTTISVNGLVSTKTGFDNLTTTIHYDALQRPYESLDALDRITGTTYVPGTALPYQITDPATNHVATYGYDAAGRVVSVMNAVGNISYTEYDRLDHVVHQWGDGAFPVAYGYNAFGERTAMRTYRAGTGWTASTWPTSTTGLADSTSWMYDPATGLLLSKTDAANRSVAFTYNARGQTSTHTWARHVGNDATKPLLAATYTYDGNTGELTDVTYNDSGEPVPTSAAHYTYTRTGLADTVTDGTGQRTFVYSPEQPQRLDAVDVSAFYGSRVLTRQYDAIHRPAGFSLGDVARGLTADLSQTYTYNDLGRFDHLTSVSAVQSLREFDYTYNSVGLISDLAVNGSPFSVSYAYETNRNLLTKVDSLWSGLSRVRYDYTYDTVGRRDTAKQFAAQPGGADDVFADFGGSTYYRYNYDSRSELIDATNYLGETPPALNAAATGAQLSGRHHVFTYDTIGNRNSAGRNGATGVSDIFTPNALNQYSQRENNVVHVAGTVSSATTSVTVTGGTVPPTVAFGSQGRYWDAQTMFDNSAHPKTDSMTITATQPGSGGSPLVRAASRVAFVPQSPQTFTYDDDGNLWKDGVWVYTFDAENRLVRMVANSTAVAWLLPNLQIDFAYDYLGRRVQKRVTDLAHGGAELSSRRYLYDGNNLIAEFATTSSGTVCGSLVRSYTWGLDLAGSLETTGGVGALLQITDYGTGSGYFPTFDANGNVAALLLAANFGSMTAGTAVAKYEYSPFGELLRCEGAYAASNPFRFSTKFTDDETGLVYYGHRYYSPSVGRFINRDPIEEAGGLDLYGFCLNDPVDKWDVLGQKDGNTQRPEEMKKQTEAADKYEKQLRENAAKLGLKYSDSAFKAAASALANAGGDIGRAITNLQGANSGTTFRAVAPNSEVTFLGEFHKEAKAFGPRTIDGLGHSANQAFLWGLDVVNAGFQMLYGEPVGSEQRWKPLSAYTTDSSITSTLILTSTADQATFGIPSGAYKMATGDYRGAQDSFGNGALTLIAADVAGTRNPNVRLGSAENVATQVPGKASEVVKWAEGQGWKRTQTANGPIKYVDENGVVRATVKQGSSRSPGSGSPHVELRDAAGQRVDPTGNPVTRKSPENHTPIEWDLD